MKKLLSYSLLVLCCTMMFCSCNKKAENYVGTYSCVYTPKDDVPGLRMYLQVSKVDTVFDAKMAIHHYYRNGFLYSEIPTTESMAFSEKNDTLSISFVLPPSPMDEEADSTATRKFTLSLCLDKNDNLSVISSDVAIVPNDSLVFVRVAENDSTFDTANFEAKRLVSRIYGGINLPLHGAIKTLVITKENGDTDTIYYDRNGFIISQPGEELEYTETRNNDGTLSIRTPRGDKYIYNADGTLKFFFNVNSYYANSATVKCNKIGMIVKADYLSVSRGDSMSEEIVTYEYDQRGIVSRVKTKQIWCFSVIGTYSEEIEVLETDDYGNPTKIKDRKNTFQYEYYE